MPFDPTFTDAEFEAAIDADPKILDRVVPVLTKKEYAVRDKATEQTFITNLEAQHASNHTKRVATEVEAKVKELTGIDKINPQEKWSEYYRRAMKTMADTAKTLQAKITDLEGKSDLSAAERQQLKALQELQVTKDSEIESLKTNHSKELTKARVENKILADVAPSQAKVNKIIPAAAIKLAHDNAVKTMLDTAIIDEHTGNVLFAGADGKVLLDNKTAAPLTAQNIYDTLMKDFYEVPKNQSGAGGNGNGGDNAIDELPADVKTKGELSTYLTKKGLIGGTKAYNEEYNKYEKQLGW